MISQFEVGQSVRNRHDHIQTSGLGRLRKFHLTMPLKPYFLYQTFLCDHRLIYLSQKASNNIPEPTDQSSFGGVQIYHQNWSSVLRSRVNRTFKYLTNSALVFWTEKLSFDQNRSSISMFLQCRWSSFRRSSRPFSELAFINLSFHAIVSILPKRKYVRMHD